MATLVVSVGLCLLICFVTVTVIRKELYRQREQVRKIVRYSLYDPEWQREHPHEWGSIKNYVLNRIRMDI